MRLALEPIALMRAIPNMTVGDFVQMDHLLNRIDHETDLTRWVELNWEFHASLYQPAHMPLLLQTVRELHHNVVRFLIRYVNEEQLRRSQAQHREIVAQCRAQNLETAVDLLRQHLGDPVEMFASNLNKD